MDENNSGTGAKFGFGNTKAGDNKQKEANDSLPVEDKEIGTVSATVGNDQEEESDFVLDNEYTDTRSVSIALVKNYSLYRRANDKVLPKRQDFIGSSVSASRTLSANKPEIEAYFPNLIGLDPSNAQFTQRVKEYLNNIRIPVNELDRTFNTSFVYYKKSDYYKYKAEEEKIEDAYKKANRQNITALRAALQDKITKLNTLESSKHKVGYPVNIDDYLMYRHCLLYKDIAKDISLINTDSNIRFYFKDNQKEAERERKHRAQITIAKKNFVSVIGDQDMFDAVYMQYCILAGLPVIASLAEDQLQKEIKLDRFSTDEPIKFNKICSNKDIKVMAEIESLIARGEFVRSQYNQNISTTDGEQIGANMGEAVAWFKNKDNTSAVNAYRARLKNI